MFAIVPTNDIRDHKDYDTTCECEPKVVFENGEMIIIHNAFDQREIIEELNEILKTV
jgi:hypothetical protein